MVVQPSKVRLRDGVFFGGGDGGFFLLLVH